MINVVIPMAGNGSRFAQAGYDKPKPFIDVNGKPMIARVLDNLSIKNARYILLAKREHLESNKDIVNELLNHYDVSFIEVDNQTEGAACTVLYAHKLINNNDSLLLANSDQLIDASIQDFINKSSDASIMTFKDNNPKWSYAKVEDGFVTEVKEKVVISDNATVGIYYFAKGKTFVNAAIDMIIHNDRFNNEFYVCPIFNYVGARVNIYNIDS